MMSPHAAGMLLTERAHPPCARQDSRDRHHVLRVWRSALERDVILAAGPFSSTTCPSKSIDPMSFSDDDDTQDPSLLNVSLIDGGGCDKKVSGFVEVVEVVEVVVAGLNSARRNQGRDVGGEIFRRGLSTNEVECAVGRSRGRTCANEGEVHNFPRWSCGLQWKTAPRRGNAVTRLEIGRCIKARIQALIAIHANRHIRRKSSRWSFIDPTPAEMDTVHSFIQFEKAALNTLFARKSSQVGACAKSLHGSRSTIKWAMWTLAPGGY